MKLVIASAAPAATKTIPKVPLVILKKYSALAAIAKNILIILSVDPKLFFIIQLVKIF
jgi:hypothetical protein